MKRQKNQSIRGLLRFTLLFAGLLNFFPFLAKAAFVPSQDQVMETLHGKWKFELSPAQIPTLNFFAENGEVSFFPEETPMEWENINKVIYLPRTQANLVLNRTGLDCLGSPLKLWFESGDSFELGKNSCSQTRLYATSRTGDRVEDRARENHLAQLLASHTLVAISQADKAFILETKKEDDVQKYQTETNPEPNSSFSKMMRKKWAESLKRGY
ncbi:hypothetical protein FAI41_04465 [Acetobacteraceae bacterium]|nr:hypothetical protein FAI41_04465 [Acetobacteraceae bacterium]